MVSCCTRGDKGGSAHMPHTLCSLRTYEGTVKVLEKPPPLVMMEPV